MFDRSIHSYSVLSDSRRIIAISDIHGNLPVFKSCYVKSPLIRKRMRCFSLVIH